MSTVLRVMAFLLLAVGLSLVAFVHYVRGYAGASEPVFTVVHDIEIAAPPEDVWRVLTDFETYPEWNPYALAIEGEPALGETIALTIVIDTWPRPLTVHPEIVRFDPPRVLAWRDHLFFAGLQDTHHAFELRPLPNGGTAFHHEESFRGWLPARVYSGEEIPPIERAFRAMNEALAARAERSSSP